MPGRMPVGSVVEEADLVQYRRGDSGVVVRARCFQQGAMLRGGVCGGESNPCRAHGGAPLQQVLGSSLAEAAQWARVLSVTELVVIEAEGPIVP